MCGQTERPVVSIIVPAYNAERFIARSLQSALRQTYRDIEVIVVDDGSTDGTRDIVQSYDDPRIVYRYQENQNQSAARNHGIAVSRGTYVTFLDTDDFYLPEKVEKSVRFLQENPSFGIVYCNTLHYFSKNPGKYYRFKYTGYAGDVLERLLVASCININSIMIRRDLFEKTGITFTEERYYPEDYELYLRFSLLGYKFGYVDSDLVVVEIRPDSVTTMDIQATAKRNTVKMLERLSAEMPEKIELSEAVTSLSRGVYRKLAIAYLMRGQRKAFFETLKQRVNPVLKVPLFVVYVFLQMVPSRLLRQAVSAIWQANRRRYYSVVRDTPGCIKDLQQV